MIYFIVYETSLDCLTAWDFGEYDCAGYCVRANCIVNNGDSSTIDPYSTVVAATVRFTASTSSIAAGAKQRGCSACADQFWERSNLTHSFQFFFDRYSDLDDD